MLVSENPFDPTVPFGPRDVVWYGLVRYGKYVWFGTVGIPIFNIIWYGLVWYGVWSEPTVPFGPTGYGSY
jgi:hypothetical protein